MANVRGTKKSSGEKSPKKKSPGNRDRAEEAQRGGSSGKKNSFLAEIERIRQNEDEIVAEHLKNAPEYVVTSSGERVKVDKAALAEAIREKIEYTLRLQTLIHDLNCTDPNDMSPSPLRDRVAYFKNTEEGRASLIELAQKRLSERAARDKGGKGAGKKREKEE